MEGLLEGEPPTGPDAFAGLGGLDAASCIEALDAARVEVRRAEARQLVLVARWIDLHHRDRRAADRPGRERGKPAGGFGTPLVAEFAAAELAVVLRVSPVTAAVLVRDVADLVHRHPLLWAAVLAGDCAGYSARMVARMCNTAGLSLEQARWVDAVTTPHLGTRSWGRFITLVQAKIIAVDPEGFEERRKAEAARMFVSTGRSDEFGLKTLVARARAGDVIYAEAMVARIAELLKLEGDTRPAGPRRAAAFRILAEPARALALLERHASTTLDPADQLDEPEPGNDETVDEGESGVDSESGDDKPGEAGLGDDVGDGEDADREPDPDIVSESDVHPSQNDADEPTPSPRPCPTCAGAGQVTGDPALFVRREWDPDKLRPKAVLYVHISLEDFQAALAKRADSNEQPRRPGTGVARMEGVGPLTVAQAREFLGHCQVSVRPVLDPLDLAPVDGYEVPDRLAEAIGLLHPYAVFPYDNTHSRRSDKDHTVAYLPPARGGPPGQTRVGNLGPLSRYTHRVKTHHPGWRHHQPAPGVFLWRTPHGSWFRVDSTGTHALGKHPHPRDLLPGWDDPPVPSPLETTLADLTRRARTGARAAPTSRTD